MKIKVKVINNAPLVIGFLLACFLATLLGQISGGRITELLFMTCRSPFRNPLTYVRMFTHVLGHDGFGHFAGNAIYLLLLGPMLEEKYKAAALLRVILITAFATAVIHRIFFPGSALCGASGVVFAFIIMASFTGFRKGEIPVTFLLAAAVWLGQQVLEGILITDQISNTAHIVGGLVGALSGYRLSVRPS